MYKVHTDTSLYMPEKDILLTFPDVQTDYKLILIHWGRVTHICVSKITIIGLDNALSPDRRQVIIWTNAGILLIEPLGINFSEILIDVLIFSFKKIRSKVSAVKWRPFCLGLSVLIYPYGQSLSENSNRPSR